MNSVRIALLFSFAERYALIAISLLSNILLARILTPEQIGIYSVSLAVTSIAQVLRDFGVGNFLIQEKNLTAAHISTAFGFALVIGGGLCLVVYLAAPFAAEFYSEPRMINTVRIGALNFLSLPFSTISLSLLRRELAFKRLAVVNLIAAMAGFLVTLVLAFLEFGQNSLAIGTVVVSVVTGLGAWFARKQRSLVLPGFSEWRTMIKFGGQSSLSGVVTSISMDANDLIVGKVLGFNPVAILSRAQGLMNLFHRDLMNAVRNVALPGFASEFRAGGNLESHYQHSVAIITVIAWPFYGAMSIYSLEALRLLFGSQWDSASPLVPIFCLAGAIAALNSLIPILLIAVGRIDLSTIADLVLQPLRLVLIAICALVFKTTEACALAFLISTAVAMPIFYQFKGKAFPTNFKILFKNIILSGVVCLATLLLPMLHISHVGMERVEPVAMLDFAVVIPLSVLMWIFAIKFVKHPLSNEQWFNKYIIADGKK